MNLETKIIIYKFTPQVFTLTRVSLNRTSCFIMANTLFPLTEHFVSSYENRLFFLIGTNCFSILEQSVHLCELTN